MKLLNKILLSATFTGICLNTFAYNMPPFTNNELKQAADSFIIKDLPNQAKKYYQELNKRNDKVNATWGLTLVDLAENKNQDALKKVNFLLTQDRVKTRTLENLQAELLVNLAEEAFYANNTPLAKNYLQTFFNKHDGHYQFQQRAKFLHRKMNASIPAQQIKVGVILPLSGKLANVGKQIQNALTMALYDEKLSNITLVIEDNESTQDGSINAATKMVNKGVNVVIGPILRDNVLAANTVISATQVPVFSFSTDRSIAGGNIFLNNINTQQESYEIARFAADIGKHTMACLTPKSIAGDVEQSSFINAVKSFNYSLKKCSKFEASNIDINPALKDLLDINKNERIRKAKLAKLEKEFEKLGLAMDDEKIKKMEELRNQENVYDIDFDAIFIPASARKIPVIAPQLAYYDIDFTNGVLFLGNSAWDDTKILKNRGEHLHFSRFLSLRSDQFKGFAKQYKARFNKKPLILAGFAYDVLRLTQQLDFTQNIYPQLHKAEGFNVLTGNVKFNTDNTADRQYGVNKISRRTIKPVLKVQHQRTIARPNELNIIKASGFGNWFGF